MTDSEDATTWRPNRALIDLAKDRLDSNEVEALELWLRAEGLAEPPPWIERRAERIALHRKPQRPRPMLRWPDAARRCVATLAFDSQAQPQFVGLRAVKTHVRRLLFQAENIEVDLEMAPDPAPASEHVRLAGQVTALGANPSGGFLRLSRETGEWMAKLDESGEFWLDSLAPGAYRLEVVLRDRVIEVPILPI